MIYEPDVHGRPFKVTNVRAVAREVEFSFPYGSSLGDTDKVPSMIGGWSADPMGEC